MKRIYRAYYIVLVAILLTVPANAYIDPSVTSYLIQAIAGIVIACGAAAGILWRRIKKAAKTKFGVDLGEKKEVESDIVVFDDETSSAVQDNNTYDPAKKSCTTQGTDGTTQTRRDMVLAWCLVISISTISTLLLYAQNVNEITFFQFLPFVAAFALIGAATFAVCRGILKDVNKAALMTAWLMAIFCNFGFLKLLFPDLHENHRLYVICGIFCIFVSLIPLWAIFRIRVEISAVLCSTFAITFSALFFLNAVFAGINGIKGERIVDLQRETLIQSAQAVRKSERPNIYFMIFDEYAGIDELKSYYHYDNSDFYKALSDYGFTMARGCTNEHTSTLYVLADLLNMQFLHQNNVSEDVLRHQIENGVMIDVMDALGYTLYDTESDRLTPLKSPISELPSYSAPVTETGGTYVKVFLYNTAAAFLYNGIENALWDSIVDRPVVLNTVTEYYATLRKPEEPSFFFSYICSPHGPFYFDADGNRIDTPDDPYSNYNWEDSSIYLGQMEYVSKRIEYAVQNIVSVDPGSIIILMSDHGSRYHPNDYDEDLARAESLDILTGVYYRGQNLDGLDGLDGVNLLRRIINETFDTDFPLLDYWEDGHRTDTVGRRALGMT